MALYEYHEFDFETPWEDPQSFRGLGDEQTDMVGNWEQGMNVRIDEYQAKLANYRSQSLSMAIPTQQTLQAQSRNHEQGPMGRFINEAEREGGQAFNHGVAQSSLPVHSLPHPETMRRASPSLSQGVSSASSAQSPATEWNYFSDSNAQKNFRYGMNYYRDLFSPNRYDGSPPRVDLHPMYHQDQQYNSPLGSGNSCVSMNEVQNFTDPSELNYDADEGYAGGEIRNHYNLGLENHTIKTEFSQSHAIYPETPANDRYGTDSALDTSVYGNDSTSINAVDDTNSDVDAEGEIDNEVEYEVENDQDMDDGSEVSDAEYTPRGTIRSARPRSRRNVPISPTFDITKPLKRGARISKSSPYKSKSQKNTHLCTVCKAGPFKDRSNFLRHQATHQRAFVCVFQFAGCDATFATKNEWKRHVSSQHAVLNHWVCELGACASTKAPAGSAKKVQAGAYFNRKDLFTQHMRRMHAPASVKKSNNVDQKWEEKLRQLQVSCLRVKRQGPTILQCCMPECDVKFEGDGCWDERMEHVGKHLERAAAEERDPAEEVPQGNDGYLIAWALDENIIEMRTTGKAKGEYRLCIDKKKESDDVEGDDD